MTRITPPKPHGPTFALDALVRRIEAELLEDDLSAGILTPDQMGPLQSALNNFSILGSGSSHIMATAK